MTVAILDWPSTLRGPSQATLGLRGRTQLHTSPFDGSVQTLALPGAKWVGTMSWGPMAPADWRNLQQFLTLLSGQAGRFKLFHPMAGRRATATPGTPLVKGGSQTGNTLAIDGCTASATILLKGDFFAWTNADSRPQLHQVAGDITANGSGEATLAFAPPLRTSPADNAPIDVLTPSAVFMLAGDDQGAISVAGNSAFRGSAGIEFEEALF
jgi:hypothetical protein